VRPNISALRITVIYLLFALPWIILSDKFLAAQITDLSTLSSFQTYKGILFVALTALMVFFLVRHTLHRQEKIEETLRVSENRFRAIFDNVNDAIFLDDPYTGKILEANAKASQMFGYSREELCRRSIADLSANFPPYTQEHALSLIAQARMGEAPMFEWLSRRRDDSHFWTEVSLRQGEINGTAQILVLIRDITERRQAEVAMRESEMRYRSLFDNMPEGYAYCQMLYRDGLPYDFIHINVNGAFEKVTGLKNAVGKKITELIPDIKQTNAGMLEKVGRVAASGKPERFDVHVNSMWLALSVYSVKTGYFVAILDNITARKSAEAQVSFLAHHDQLTSLPNRVLVRDRFEQEVAHAVRNQSKVALIFIDLDHFKNINDTLGHVVGDALLKVVATRLRQCVRESDTISRQGGDEFLIVLSDIRDTDAITSSTTKILERLALPFQIDHHELSTSASIGTAVYPEDGEDFDTLLKKADTAMYHAKEAGRNSCHFFDLQMNAHADEHLRMRNSLRLALEREEFVLHYQPQINLATGALIGAEALIRWNHPELGLVVPQKFIPLAEDSGLIVPIGEWVLREACRQAVIWQQTGLAELVMAVNLSAVQFKRSDLEKTIIAALDASGLPPRSLELELTESILIRDTENVLRTVQRLKLLGVKLSIDDFGTGYSSLAYLSRFPVDKVKIDQSFIRGLSNNSSDTAIVRAVIQMARSMGLKTIAEGVEEESMLTYLRAHHCDEAQGFYIGKPMPAVQFTSYMSSAKKLHDTHTVS
jgi:diguanylate cyclase (GGDEF)-like protein/PAS domain S-box-containing protein